MKESKDKKKGMEKFIETYRKNINKLTNKIPTQEKLILLKQSQIENPEMVKNVMEERKPKQHRFRLHIRFRRKDIQSK